MSDGLTHWQQKVMNLAQGHTVDAVRAMPVKELKDIVSSAAASAAGAGAAAGVESSPSKLPSGPQLKFASKVAGQARVFGPQQLVDAAPQFETASFKEVSRYLDLFTELNVPADQQWASEPTLNALKSKGLYKDSMNWMDGMEGIGNASCDFSQDDASKELSQKRDANPEKKRKSM